MKGHHREERSVLQTVKLQVLRLIAFIWMLALGLGSSTLLELRVLPFYAPSGLPVSNRSPAPTFVEKQPFFPRHLLLGWHQAVGSPGRFAAPGEQGELQP